ncbi:MAG TPA: hypothetical protein DDW91_11800, partial [Shewanella frigidimarina]|nr:hypothetical protein [Shewanella frigidimarina]
TSSAFEICSENITYSIADTDSQLTFVLEHDYAKDKPGSIIANLNEQDTIGKTFLWQQVSGPILELAAVNSQVLAFTPTSNQDYAFKVKV